MVSPSRLDRRIKPSVSCVAVVQTKERRTFYVRIAGTGLAQDLPGDSNEASASDGVSGGEISRRDVQHTPETVGSKRRRFGHVRRARPTARARFRSEAGYRADIHPIVLHTYTQMLIVRLLLEHCRSRGWHAKGTCNHTRSRKRPSSFPSSSPGA